MATLATCKSARITREMQKPRVLGTSYRVLRWVAEGSFADVALAADECSGEHVALKVLKPQWRKSVRMRRQLLLEAQALAQVEHRHVVGYRNHDADGAAPFVAMEWLGGSSLRATLDTGALPPLTSLRLCLQMTTGLQAIHDQGLVHADIKPENIMMRPAGDELVLTDLGAVRPSGLALRGPICGSPRYMAPEQALGGVCDARTDLYSLGKVMAEIAAAFSAPPPGLTALIRACTQEDPAGRPQSAREITRTLCRLLPRPCPRRRRQPEHTGRGSALHLVR